MNHTQDETSERESLEALLQEGTFEDTLAALEQVVARLEQGHLPLESAVRWYETGLRLSRRCQELLAEAELRIERLDRLYDSGDWTGGANRVDE